MNRNNHSALSISIALLASHLAMAGPVAGLTTFTAGTAAKASEVNANFTAVKTAVDDNNTRLTTVESTKQNRVSGTCVVGSAITAIGADGTVSCAAASPDARFGTDTSVAIAGRGGDCVIGQVWLVAGVTASGTPAAGQTLLIADYTPLFALIGTNYGGDGVATFALPNLRNAAPNGLTYVMCLSGIFPITN